MCHFTNKLAGMTNDQTVSFLQTYSLAKGLKQFGDRRKIATHKEMKQLHDRFELYRMMLSSILYYKKFRKDIESIGFKVNPYDICVANRIINGK